MHAKIQIWNTLKAESDIQQMIDNAENMQDVGLGGEFALALVGGHSMAEALEEFNEKLIYTHGNLNGIYTFGGYVASGALVIAFDEIRTHTTANTSDAITGWNFVNWAESAADKENEMTAELSELTAQTVESLQGNLRQMLDAQAHDCPCASDSSQKPLSADDVHNYMLSFPAWVFPTPPENSPTPFKFDLLTQ
jgi:hypothetical protein